MKILFIHQNFPGQFKNLAPALAMKGHQVTALTLQRTNLDKWQGVTLIKYSTHRVSTPQIHPWYVDFETKIIRAEACYQAAMTLKKKMDIHQTSSLRILVGVKAYFLKKYGLTQSLVFILNTITKQLVQMLALIQSFPVLTQKIRVD